MAHLHRALGSGVTTRLLLGVFATSWSALIVAVDGGWIVAIVWFLLQMAALAWAKPSSTSDGASSGKPGQTAQPST
jgi:hypothetical protein